MFWSQNYIVGSRNTSDKKILETWKARKNIESTQQSHKLSQQAYNLKSATNFVHY